MLEITVILCIVLFYVSLFIELFSYNIPSVVATRKILNPELLEHPYFSDKIKKYLNYPKFTKYVLFVLPMVFIYVLHLFPMYYLIEIVFCEKPILEISTQVFLGILLVFLGRIISHFYLNKIQKIKKQSFNGFVASGVYKYSRNPGLIGLYVSFLGFFLIKPNIFFLFCFVVYIVHMHFKIMMEEDYLTNKHGKEYSAYLQKTKRYL